jgi:hypothetical protein
MMTRPQREQIRLSLLRYCEASGQYGLSEALLLQFIRSEGWRALAPEELHAETVYLADKSLLAAVEKIISPENHSWRITALGRDYLAQNFAG